MRLGRGGFSLIESVLALALFAFAAVAIGRICFNCIYPLDIKDKDTLADAVLDRASQAVLGISSYDELDDGTEVKNLDGQTYRVYGYAEPTQILDLFELEIVAYGGGNGGELRRKTYVIRPGWYENSLDRERLLEDRTDFLDKKRRYADSEDSEESQQ